MKGIVFFSLALFCIIAQPVFADVIGGGDEEVRAVAEPILDTILEGFKNNDYVKYSTHLDQTLKEAVSEAKFAQTDSQIESSIGEYVSREYFGFLDQGQMTVVLWKGDFDNTEDDILIKLVISKRDGEYLVTGLWFQ
ncbi:MAG: DUF3887 domain-containing protein [Candidatus Omnitrophica bacterium]|nr:DUF3887 domain-containing protein [Candidatus Omnitrophota bacterium]